MLQLLKFLQTSLCSLLLKMCCNYLYKKIFVTLCHDFIIAGKNLSSFFCFLLRLETFHLFTCVIYSVAALQILIDTWESKCLQSCCIFFCVVEFKVLLIAAYNPKLQQSYCFTFLIKPLNTEGKIKPKINSSKIKKLSRAVFKYIFLKENQKKTIQRLFIYFAVIYVLTSSCSYLNKVFFVLISVHNAL